MSANVSPQGTVRQLDRIPQPPSPVTDETVKDAPTLARLVLGLIRDVSRLLGYWRPRRMDFEGLVSTGTDVAPQSFRLTHGFGGAVRWWVVDRRSSGAVAVPYEDRTDDDPDVITIRIFYEATVTVRVEEAG